MSEARFTVKVERDGDTSHVVVWSHGRPVADREISTLGDCMGLGQLLVDPQTPFLPVAPAPA